MQVTDYRKTRLRNEIKCVDADVKPKTLLTHLSVGAMNISVTYQTTLCHMHHTHTYPPRLFQMAYDREMSNPLYASSGTWHSLPINLAIYLLR